MNIASLLIEINHLSTWFPLMEVSRIEKKINVFRNYAYFSSQNVWPFSEREIFMEICAFTLTNTTGIAPSMVGTLKSFTESSWLGHQITKKEGFTTMDFHKSFLILTPLSETRTRFRYFFNADPSVEWIPVDILNWGLRAISGQFLEYILTKAGNPLPLY